MIRIRRGAVIKIISNHGNTTIVNVSYDGKIEKTINYNNLTGHIMLHDIVYINTSANYLNLGSGGYNYVIINETRGSTLDINDIGHIMKLRYTPYQIKCNYPYEKNSEYSNEIEKFKSLDNMIVISGELHSMLVPTAYCLKFLKPDIKITYIMTDGGSLPIDFSFNVNKLKAIDIISSTITYGNSYGGDMEALNIYDALVIAKTILKCDIIIITMGPGAVGTGTKYGFSGIEQGNIIDAVNTFHGIPVVIPRLSFNDLRERHYGISHHTLTVLSEITKTKAYITFPVIETNKMNYIKKQLEEQKINDKHYIKYINSNVLYSAIEYYKFRCTTMGRSFSQDREFFLACSCASQYSIDILNNSI